MLALLPLMCKNTVGSCVVIAICLLITYRIVRLVLIWLHLWPKVELPHKRKSRSSDSLYVVLIHPNLTIGGAERLMIDAALGLEHHQSLMKVQCHMITTHHDHTRAFPETVNGTLRVTVYGDWLPLSIIQRGKVLCNTLRMMYASFVTCLVEPHVDCFIVDQVAMAMPLIKWYRPYTPILFYCHFPDQRCDGNRNEDGTFHTLSSSTSSSLSMFKASVLHACHVVYRLLFDKLESFAMSFATYILSNSHFSQDVLMSTFPWLAPSKSILCEILYPPIPLQPSSSSNSSSAEPSTEHKVCKSAKAEEGLDNDKTTTSNDKLRNWMTSHIVFVSINRYERKKTIEYAISGFKLLMERAIALNIPHYHRLRLVIAGGYNPEFAECVEYAAELQALASEIKAITNTVTAKSSSPTNNDDVKDKEEEEEEEEQLIKFMYNITDEEKHILLENARALLYTSANEHFGIVPVEAMQKGTAVIAVNHGGPCESVGTTLESKKINEEKMPQSDECNANVDEGNTEGNINAGGLLCAPSPAGFADAMMKLVTDDTLAKRLGENGKLRAMTLFSINAFSEQLVSIIM